MNQALLEAVKEVAARRAERKLSRGDALRVLVNEGICHPNGELTKTFGGHK